MPIRHEGNERVGIRDWDSWIEKELEDARARGEFDDLSTTGQPIDLASTDVNREWDFAFSRMKNAGVMPAWMELDQQCHALRAELDAFLERSASYLRDLMVLLDAPLPDPAIRDEKAAPRWQVWKHVGGWLQVPGQSGETDAPLDRLDLVWMRANMKAQYLERAAILDKRIVEFNGALSESLRHLERMRMLPDRATRLFEKGMPPIA